MSTLNPPKSISRRHELREDKVITFYARAWQYFDQNRTLIYAILAGLVLLVLLLVGWIWYQNQQAQEAERHLGRIVPVYEAGDYEQALEGEDGRLGLVEIADEYGRTDAGNLARFYAADAYFKLGQYDRAQTYFSRFDKGDDILGASAIAGEAAALEAQGEHRRAADLYRRAALHHENSAISPQYLLSAGRAYEEAGDYERALDAYRTIPDRFEDAPLADNIDAYIARAEARQQTAQ